MSETRSTAPPGGEPVPGDAAPPPPVEAAALAALNGHAEPTDDTPTIISRNSPHVRHEEPPGGLRGRKLAHFELIEPIGVGGMAAVIRARDTQLDRLVALKILPPDMAEDPECVRRFQQEARSAARLDHENIARVFFCGEDQRLHFIAFEFVEGDNLRTILERRGRLPVAEALHYVLQIAAGLAHAAQRGVVHRDIKPSNIIVTPTGRAKLVDMGLARSLERQDDQALTQSGMTLGTFDYISPEQALEPREADVRSDIYSLGCTFYHLVTGRPAVPEGTAAKKLHHHQHVKPRDPRELVPGLPDDAAVILDRMMAKRPQDRYQSPEQLVQHLLLAARQLGGPGNVPEGVLSVEAVLPPPPGNRPLLLAGLAAGLVVLLIVVLEAIHRPAAAPTAPTTAAKQDEPGSDPDPTHAAPPSAVAIKDKPGAEKIADPPAQPQPVKPARVAHYDGDGRDLLDWLKSVDKDAPKEIVLGGDINLLLPTDGDAGLVLAGPKVTLQAKTPGARPTIRFTHDSRFQEGPNPWTAVDVDSPDATVRGVRILVDGQKADVRMDGLRLHGPAGKDCKFLVDNCEFIQARPGAGEKRLISLEADGADAWPTSLTLSACRFLSFTEVDGDALVNDGFGGGDAVLRDGAVGVLATDCAFGPHGAAFRVEGGDGETAPRLTLSHCSVLAAGPSAVFDVGPGASVDLNVRASLFSHPGGPNPIASPDEWAALIRQADLRGDVFYADRDNRFQGLDTYWRIDDEQKRVGWDEFSTKVQGYKTSLVTSLVLTDSPWKYDPFQPFRRYNFRDAAAEDHFVAAFQIQDSQPKLRLASPVEKGLPAGVKVLGGVDYAELLRKADDQAKAALLKRRIVDPSGKGDRDNRVYKTLEEALSASEPGDEIVLRWDGAMRVQPNRLDKNNVQDVTMRPEGAHHPVLELVAATDRDAEPAMFRVYDGKLKLEGLEFLLQPDDKFARQSVIDLAGQGQCILKNCVVTLDRAGQPTQLAAALVSDPGKAMMMPARPADAPPQLTLDGCLVRGDGDLIACQVSRPFGLTAENTLAALKGSFLNAEAGPDAAATTGGSMALTLRKVTTYLTGNLIRLRAGKDYRSLTLVRCAPTDCLFVAAARDPQPLVQLDNLEEESLARALAWDGGGRLDYGNYQTMLELAPADGTMAMPIGQKQWESQWGKNPGDRQVTPFHFGPPIPPAADDPFQAVEPQQFRPQDQTDGCGADVNLLDKLLPPTAPK